MFESVLIVFSVVLALGVTNWAEARKTDRQVAEARAFLISELQANQAILVDPAYLAHHRRLRGIFNDLSSSGALTQESVVPAFGALFETGIHVPPLRSAVWRSVNSGDLTSEMDLEELFLLSDIYALQTRLEGQSVAFLGSTGTILAGVESGEGPRAGVTSVGLYLGDLVAAEEALIQMYDRALLRLEAGEAAPPAPPTRRDQRDR